MQNIRPVHHHKVFHLEIDHIMSTICINLIIYLDVHNVLRNIIITPFISFIINLVLMLTLIWHGWNTGLISWDIDISTGNAVRSDVVIVKLACLFKLLSSISMHIYFDCINIHVTYNEYIVTPIDIKVYIEPVDDATRLLYSAVDGDD